MSKDIKNEELVASADSMSDNIRFNIYNGVRVIMETLVLHVTIQLPTNSPQRRVGIARESQGTCYAFNPRRGAPEDQNRRQKKDLCSPNFS